MAACSSEGGSSASRQDAGTTGGSSGVAGAPSNGAASGSGGDGLGGSTSNSGGFSGSSGFTASGGAATGGSSGATSTPDSGAGGNSAGGAGTCTATADVSVNDAATGTGNDEFDFEGSWSTSTAPEKYDGDDHFSSTTGDTATLHFVGVAASLNSAKASHHGIAEITVDGGSPVEVDLYAATRADDVDVFDTGPLIDGPHTLVVRVSGMQNASSTGTTVSVDRVVVTESTCGGQADAGSGGTPSTGGASSGGASGARAPAATARSRRARATTPATVSTSSGANCTIRRASSSGSAA
jgi:hypothetical protein